VPDRSATSRLVTPGEESDRVWYVALMLCALAIGLQTGFAPLSDPDLPSHLSMGEWILAHRAVPFVEPFAWTRPGAPYFAYSWMPQVAMFALLRSGGTLTLHVFAGLLGAGIVLASAVASRALGLRASGAVLFGLASAALALQTTPFLRPQLLMHILVPLAWMCVARSRGEGVAPTATFATLVLLNALAASVHITFLVMAVPLTLYLAEAGPTRVRSAVFACVASALGWLLSPYGARWLAVFALNFGANAMTKYPAPAGELTPGFVISPWFGLGLAAVPLLAVVALRDRQRLVYGALWLVGLIAFGRMFKALGPWWWCATPMVIAALQRLPRASSLGTRCTFAALAVIAAAAMAIPNVRVGAATVRYESAALHGQLPSLKGFASEPLARWLELHMRRDASGKLLTVFIYGSYLKWRLPSLSESIDGRTIFPDSAALPDVVWSGSVHLGPWRSADLAVVPLSYPVAAVLDADAAWCRVGVASPAPWDTIAPRAALWVRRAWWVSARAASALSTCGPNIDHH
jgi:hypothetical protein